jgi:ABC-type nitrate/sulfonate/bicarbonate transport system substrate-binding protein
VCNVSDLNRRQFLGRGAALGAFVIGGPTLLAACGDDDSSGGSGATQKLGTAGVQFSWIKNVEFAGSYLADTNGYYTKVGFDKVDLLSGGPNVATEPVVNSGKALIGYTFTEPLAAAMKEGAKFKIIAAMFQKNPFGILSVEAKPIKTPNDLIGKKVGVQAVNEPIWDALLKINKLDATKITKVPVQFDPTPLVNGEVDGWFAFVINEPITVKEKNGKPVVMALQDVGFTVFQQLVITTEDALKNNRAKVKALLQAELMGWQKNLADPAVGAKLAVENYGKDLGLTLAHETEENRLQIELQKSPTTDKKGLGYMSAEDIDKNLSVLSTMGLSSITKSTYINDLLDEIYKDGTNLLK